MVLKKPHLIDANALREHRLDELAPKQLLVCGACARRGG
jgi:hypothetical protein